ncbi:ABC transporter permease (plasmid) [Coraliomargarita sp. W4R53]
MSLMAATRSESTKQFTTSMWWILAIVLVAYIAFTAAALGFVFAASASGALPGDGPQLPASNIAPMLYSTATSVGYVFPLLIGTMIVTGEFRHKTLTPTFLAVPRRGRVLWAKLIASVPLGALYGLLGVIAAVIPAAVVLAVYDLDTELGSTDTWAMLARMVLAYLLWVFVGIGVGALVRNQVGAIVGVLVFTQFLEPIGRTAAAFVDGLSGVTQFLPGAASDALVGASVLTMATPDAAADTLAWWVGGVVLLGYAAVLLGLGSLLSWRRDVS